MNKKSVIAAFIFLLLVAILYFSYDAFHGLIDSNNRLTLENKTISAKTQEDTISLDSVFILVNEERKKKNLALLQKNGLLENSARRKAYDLIAQNYWSHTDPQGRMICWTYILEAGYDYEYAGENLAKDFTSAAAIVNGWMQSKEHRDNILNPHYKDIGLAKACVYGSNFYCYIVAHFGELK